MDLEIKQSTLVCRVFEDDCNIHNDNHDDVSSVLQKSSSGKAKALSNKTLNYRAIINGVYIERK